MSNQSDEPESGVSDEDLPEDLQPTDDNPLAQPLTEDDDAASPEELDVLGGKSPDEDDETEDTDDSDADGAP